MPAKSYHNSDFDPAREVVGHQVLDPKRKRDPQQGLKAIGQSYAGFLSDVVKLVKSFGKGSLVEERAPQASAPMTTIVHLRVREGKTTAAKGISVLSPGTRVLVLGVEPGEVAFGVSEWCLVAVEGQEQGWCWGGGLR